MPPVAPVERRADLDWLRVLAFGLLIFYHAGMAWSGWSWHVTSPHSLDGLREAMRFLNRWRMPLIFMVSGAAIVLALGDRTPGAFVRVHKSHLVNIARVVEVTPWVSGDWRIRLQGGAEVNLSRRYRQRFEALAPVRT